MEKTKMTLLKGIVLLLLLVTFLGGMAGCNKTDGILEVPPEEEYSYINPDETKAETDAGFVIDGILDEEAYKKNNWLYLHNDDGGNNVNIAMTSHFGQKGMYFVFDVTESVPIYVNLERASYMNSCIEIYLSAPHVTSMRENDVFEIDLLPTGDMLFKRSNGRDGYSNVATTDDIMACLGTTTKGGAVNTADCYGYCMELFIPWDYLRWLKMDVEAIQNGYVYVNPAHITSYNHNGTDTGIDRYWYHYVQQNGVSFSNVSRHFRFNGQGVMGSVPVTLQQGEHYTLSGASAVIPGMNAIVTVKPDEGYALTSIMLNGEEQIRNVSFNEDGSVTLTILGTNNGAKVSAKAEAVTEGTKTLSGKIVLNNISKDSLDGLLLTYTGPKGEKPLEPDADGKFALKDLEQGYYTLRAEKEGYRSVSRSIYLNQDFDTELVLECDLFRVTLGNAWILDEQNDGVLYKKDGEGQVLSNTSYNSFTFRANLKYDLTLAGQGTADSYTQQRSGMQIRFSNGKSWHINMLKEKGKYILQYAKISGNNSVTGWQTIHTLSAGQIGRYTSKDGIQLSVMRQGNYAAIWLGDELIKIEILDTQYRTCSAQLGLESWASNRELLKVPFSIQNHSALNLKDLPILDDSKPYYDDFTFRATLKFNPSVAVLGTGDEYTQQRTGMQIRFRDGKSWHIDLLQEKGNYILQYAKISGENSLTNWQTVHTLGEEQIKRYTGKSGIELCVMRQGNYAAVWLDDQLIKIEILDEKYDDLSAQLALETWAYNQGILDIPFSIQNQSALNLKDLPILDDSKPYYDDFTFRATLKFNPSVAVLGTGDEYTQQRTGMQIRFRDGKSWHIDLLQEKGNYILQYAKISGENSLTNWQTVHTLDEEQIKRYTGKSGIELCVMRQGNFAAIWLDDALIKIEILDEKYDDLSAQLALETWAYKQGILDIPFRIENHATVDVKGSPFLAHAKTWNISGQYEGKLYKQGTEGVYTVLESVIVTNDVTTVATDLSPDTKDYSLAYLFKFSNGEQFRVRLHHTDKDGVYRIQTMNGSTVVPEWKVGYALTEEQAAKVMTGGIEFRVQLSDTSAYVYLDGQEVCTYDLSKNLASGQPSGVDKATAKVGFSLDGNYGRTTELPFKLADVSKDVKIYVTDVANGIITANKESCKIGETVTLTIAGNPGCYYNEICINGEKIDPAWDGTYSYKATENIYIVTGSFAPGDFRENKETAWNVLKQNQNLLYMQAHTEGDSGWLNTENDANDISATVWDASADAKNFAMIYHFDFSNGETLRLRLHHTDSDGKYRIQVMDNSTVSEQWKSHYTLTDAEAAMVQGDGIKFRTWIDGTNAVVYLDGNPVCTIDLAKVLSTGNASGVGKATVRIKIKMDGNLNQAMEIPFKLTDTGKQVLVNIESLSNGNVTTAEASYQVGDTVVLTITPDAGYSQKLYINGEPLLLDWKTNTYSFTATEEVYDITGTFEPSLNITPKDIKRWDTANQAHGILNAYYPGNDDAWLIEIKDEYRSISVKAKNYLPGEDGTGVEGFAVNLGFKLSNGKEYIFRIIKEKGKYYHQRFGINGNDWKKTELDAAAIESLCGDGVNFKLERTSTSTLTLSVNGVVYDNYIMAGVTADTKVTTAIIGHYGNRGEKIALPFVLKTPADTVNANLNIAETVNGTVTAGQENYQVGDTVILTVTPDAGYALKSLVVKKDGQPVEIGSNYSFVIEEGVYTVEAEFIASMFKIVSGNWDLSNQFDGVLTITAQKDGTTVLTNANSYREVSVTVKDYTPSKNTDGSLKQGNFSMQISFIFDNGKEYQVRMHNTDKDGNYKLQNMGGTNSLTGWKWQADLTTAQKQKLLEGDGVEFTVKLVGSNAELYVDGTKMATVALGAEYAGKTAQIKLCMNGNKGVQNLEIPFALK